MKKINLILIAMIAIAAVKLKCVSGIPSKT